MNPEPYGAGQKNARPAWATWLIVGLVMFVASLAMFIMGGWQMGFVFGLAVIVCLVGAGISALTRVRG